MSLLTFFNQTALIRSVLAADPITSGLANTKTTLHKNRADALGITNYDLEYVNAAYNLYDALGLPEHTMWAEPEFGVKTYTNFYGRTSVERMLCLTQNGTENDLVLGEPSRSGPRYNAGALNGRPMVEYSDNNPANNNDNQVGLVSEKLFPSDFTTDMTYGSIGSIYRAVVYSPMMELSANFNNGNGFILGLETSFASYLNVRTFSNIKTQNGGGAFPNNQTTITAFGTVDKTQPTASGQNRLIINKQIQNGGYGNPVYENSGHQQYITGTFIPDRLFVGSRGDNSNWRLYGWMQSTFATPKVLTKEQTDSISDFWTAHYGVTLTYTP